VAELMEKETFRNNPLSCLTFRDERQTFCFSTGVLIERLPQDFEMFLNEFLDKDKIVFENDEILRFIQHVYMPNRKLIFWKIQVDFLSFIPQEVTPIPLLRIGYKAPTLTPTLFFQYDGEVISPDFNRDVVSDKRTGKKYQRLMDMEMIYQQDLMTLFNEFKLPFLLQSPGDIALFMDKVVPLLIERGWLIQSDAPQFNVLPDPVELSFSITSSGQDWFHFSPNCDVAGQKMSLQEITALMVQNQGYVKTQNGFVKLSEKTQQELKTLSSAGAFLTGKVFSKKDILPLASIGSVIGDGVEAEDFIARLKQSDPNKQVMPGPSFSGSLRDYQQYGLNWLGFLSSIGLGGILADDMGLGKTVQTIALASSLEGNEPVLVIGPTNVIYNWASEVQKFTKDLTCVVYSGSNRQALRKDCVKANFVVTSFGIVRQDLDFFKTLKTKAIFIDEAQYIKNPKAQISQAIKALKSPFILAMTGTPIENHLQDLWNLFDTVMPGYLGAYSAFDNEVKCGRLDALKMKVRPFVLRREKREVLKSLPEKIEIVLKCPLSDVQHQLYQAVLDAVKKGIRIGGKVNKLSILTSLLKLRQVCIHPGLLAETQYRSTPSAKFDLLKEKLEELVDEDHKVVVFTQFTGMLDIVQDWLKEQKIYFERIDGSITGKARMSAVDRFQDHTGSAVFLVSLKAGGVGINLTAADYVIHLDPWWNPAVESQATDRVHRMGQQQTVMVLKMIAEGTIEEKIQELQGKKKELLARIVDVDDLADKSLDLDEVTSLLFD